ncbi:MAG TPA: PKD domain-containing protein [Brumimicrobium sp.]|nr:PKD domain-containing protein [Brumimicrobium sp.]
MKNNLENAFRNSLKDYEAPYDPKAWEAVSSQLGAPAATAATTIVSTTLKWALAGVLLVAVVGGTLFLWSDKEIVNTAEVQNTSNIEKTIKTTPNQDMNSGSDNNSFGVPVDALIENEKAEDKSIVANEEIKKRNPRNNNVTQGNVNPTKSESKPRSEVMDAQTPNSPNNQEVTGEMFTAGHLSSSVVCEGESVVINNQDEKAKVKFKANDKWIELDPGKSFVLNSNSSFDLDFVNGQGEVIGATYVKVNSLPSANFTFEANIYEEGLPVTTCEAYGDYVSYNWTFEDKIARKGAEVKHHFYEKGEYDVELKVMDVNGCESTTTKTVRILDKYNLMAVDAFKPNGSDSRNRTFMPYSLTERDVKFLLTIVDPIDNSIVFSSNDANNAWDGVDQKSGKMTPSNKAYIWKVQIMNPLPNERPIYAGTIVHN